MGGGWLVWLLFRIPVALVAVMCHSRGMPSPLLKTIGAEWRATALDSAPWIATPGERPGGEAQGFWVTRDSLRGYLKPSKADANVIAHPRAAHEKIAADLAFDLALPVPPAILVDGTNAAACRQRPWCPLFCILKSSSGRRRLRPLRQPLSLTESFVLP